MCKEWIAEDDNFPDNYSIDDWVADYCIYATDGSLEEGLEPQREEIECYLGDYYTDHYQRDMPTGDSNFGVLFYCKLNPCYSDKVKMLVERIKVKELTESGGGRYAYAVKREIDNAVDEVYWEAVNNEYEYWLEQVKSDYDWIQDVGRVGRSGGHIKIISCWPGTTDELAERVKDCIAIDQSIKETIQWLESEEFLMAEYEATFDIKTETEAEVATVAATEVTTKASIDIGVGAY